MAEKIGMDPEQVEAQRAALSREIEALESVGAAIRRVRIASVNPFDYGIEPGGLILAPTAIAATSVAIALVRDAKAGAEALVGQLLGQIIQQQDASAAGGTGSMLTVLSSFSAKQLIALLTADPDLAQSLWNNPPIWVAAAIVVVVIAGVVVIGVTVNEGQRDATDRRPRALLTQVLGWVDDTVKTAGGTWPGWSTGTAGYFGEPCSSDDNGARQYNVVAKGAGVSDPASAAAKMAAHWESLGYSVRSVGKTDPTNADYTEIVADFPRGGVIVYSVSKEISGIDASSECSTDPAMVETTK